MNMAANRGLSVKCCRQLLELVMTARRSHLLNGGVHAPVIRVPGGRIVLNVQYCTGAAQASLK